MKKTCLAVVAVCMAAMCLGVENHADGIIARILENAAKIRDLSRRPSRRG